ncbi:hypothetical protein M430DRAFT_276051 [Amorphotheca resinae ATCC 22711]|jgi:S-formylglutathione hydrolase FrmB|uniref:Uncharacterized protein n=1 Tax=Amorphotheca resinae ATCC 22711 TaxID=857342 RepID=A0A2T3B1S2_AMORE|nr:hypothetical protein M430DRAFT_276051 [Amorphotheca resinae ATCC 22711]PSS18514.1 hypothetical protein M430DRAFT_276051 [Amorphotheca resinae ATCC 22711]
MDSKSPPRAHNGEGQVSSRKVCPEGTTVRRMTRFPRGTRIQAFYLSTIGASQNSARVETSGAACVPRLPLSVNPPTATPSRPTPVQYKNPWETYKSIRLVERGGMVTVACAHLNPVKMVTIKRLSSNLNKELAVCRHELASFTRVI